LIMIQSRENLKSSELLNITADMVKQYYYCPRKIYWIYVHRINTPKTPQIERGIKIQRKVWYGKKAIRRDNYEIKRQQFLYSKDLGLSGIIDILLFKKSGDEIEEIIPIEIKTSSIKTHKPRKQDTMQLIAYIVLAKERWNKTHKGILYYKEMDKKFVISLSNELYSELLRAIKAIRRIILDEYLPEGTSDIRKCYSCEARKLCKPDL